MSKFKDKAYPLTERITLYNMDCNDFMAELPDNYYSLAIADPPYGMNKAKKGTVGGGSKKGKPTTYTKKEWDKNPFDERFFQELMRISENQIIWGANHFISKIPIDSSCWIVWDKNNEPTKFADCELAWTSFSSAVRKCKFTWNGFIQGDNKSKEERIHPTQKPAFLYQWLLNKYAKKGDRIFDPCVGSGSSAIAAHQLGFEYEGCELDEEYINLATSRIKEETRQLQLFNFNDATK